MNRRTTFLYNKKGYEKVLSILGMICSISIIVMAIMQLSGKWDKAINVFEPLLGVLMLIQALESWRRNRKLAVFSLCVALFIFVCAILVFVIR